MKKPSNMRAAVMGLALLALANGLALAGAGWNRGGEDSRLRVSERELSRPWELHEDNEDSSLWLELDYEVANSDNSRLKLITFGSTKWDDVSWLDARRLGQLGFDVTPPPITFGDSFEFAKRSRPAFIVLEFDGPAYAARLRTLELEARTRTDVAQALERARNEASRLYAIDVGRDADTLRVRYTDRRRYAIVPGVIDMDWNLEDSRLKLSARLRVLPKSIHLDASQASALGVRRRAPADWAGQKEAPFEVDLAFGRRGEPWIVNARQAPR